MVELSVEAAVSKGTASSQAFVLGGSPHEFTLREVIFAESVCVLGVFSCGCSCCACGGCAAWTAAGSLRL